jgi:hypothetical protein
MRQRFSQVQGRPSAWMVAVLGVVVGVAALAGCAGGGDRPLGELRMTTDSFTIRVRPDPAPPYALDQTTWTVRVSDKATGQPVQGGQGRIFATNRDGKSIDNGFEEATELGTYKTRLMFLTSGMWAMGVQFRRDSTKVLQRTKDWTQDVRADTSFSSTR